MITHEASSSSSSKSKLWNYDVFLSFSGVDTRSGFTGHLHAALTDRGYQAYIDEDDLERGEEIKEELFRAIKEARISIIVFSKSYADSSWCLDELVKIMECRYKPGRHVLPIFYHVDPSHVRKQNEDLAQAFQKHEEGIREEKDDKERETRQERVKQWRKALTEAANLSGQHLQITDKGREAKLIREIVDKIIPKWLPIAEELQMAKHPVGIYTRIQDIITYLSNAGSDVVCMVGIWGMGGLGKTTAAKAIYNKIHHEFQFKSFLDNVSEKDLVVSQKKLVSDILKQTKPEITSVDEGISPIKNHLQRRSVLVIIDNVDRVEQLNAIAGNRDWFGPGSRIIITTQDERLLKQVNMKVDKTYPLKEMNDEEALKLFSWHAFGNSWPNEGYLELSKEVVSYCGGLPLALEVLGGSMIERTPTEWKNQLEKLKKFPEEGIMKPLRVSFERLDPTQKDIFLDISCFFIGWDKDRVAKILDGCEFFATVGISDLRERCLVTVEHNRLNMHDLLREMAKLIISEKFPRHPGKWSRLWNHQEVTKVLGDNSGTEEVEGLALYGPPPRETEEVELAPDSEQKHSSKFSCFSTEGFANMKKLRLLQLCKVQLNGEYKHLSKELIWLSWSGCPLKSIPDDFFDQPRLVSLEITSGKLVQVWEGSKSLENLKFLDLRSCLDLKKSPDFSNLPNLEELMLEWCVSLSEIHPSIGHLKKLSLVNLTGCKNLISLPGDFYNSKSVQTLVLDECCQFSELPEDIGKIISLRVLKASFTAIRQVPRSTVRLMNLTHLSLAGVGSEFPLRFPDSLHGLDSLRNLDLSNNDFDTLPSLNGLSKLESLRLSDCHHLHTLPSLSSLSKLDSLQLSNCHHLHTLPSLSGLSKLESLQLSKCYHLHTLPSLNGLSKLESLQLSDCHHLHTLPSLSGLSKLESLQLSKCYHLHTLPSLSSLSKLESLQLSDCHHLHTLPSLSGLSKLESLQLSQCYHLHTLPSLSGLSKLESLQLSDCHHLHTLPSLSGLSKLESLQLSKCYHLHTLASLSGLSKLESLQLSDCHHLHTLPSLSGLSKLESLQLSKCYLLHTLPNLSGLSKLESLQLSDCHHLDTLPSLSGLSKLESLQLSKCYQLHTLPSLSGLSKLESLQLSDCHHLHTLPSLSGISKLESLQLNKCYLLHTLPSLSGLSKLESLQLSDCHHLETLPSLSGLSKLESLQLSKCYHLHTLPSLSGLSKLESLQLSDCHHLRTLPSLSDLSKLESLQLSDCHHLRTLPSLSGISKLESLQLSKCYHLRTLPSLSGLSKLESLQLSDCHHLHTVSSLSGLSKLKSLQLSNCYHLRTLPSLSGLSKLKSLQLSNCHHLPTLPSLSGLSKLESLQLSNCYHLHTLPSLSGLSKLESLQLSDCHHLDTLPSLSGLSKLESLQLSNCHHLHTLPSLNGLSKLESLRLRNCHHLHTLPSLNGLSKLESLRLRNCHHLHTLPSLSDLSKLESLWLHDCLELRTIYDLPTNLKFLGAPNCLHLVTMPNFSKMSNMRELIVCNSYALTEVPDLDKSLYSLTWIDMRDCPKLTADFRRNVLKGWTSCGYGGIFLNGNYVPDWFEFVNNGDEVSFDIPPSDGRNFEGLTLLCFYSSDLHQSSSHIRCKVAHPHTSIDINNTKRNELRTCIGKEDWVIKMRDVVYKECFLWQGQISNDKLNLQSGDKVDITFEMPEMDYKNYYATIQGTGVNLVWDKPMKENIHDFDRDGWFLIQRHNQGGDA